MHVLLRPILALTALAFMLVMIAANLPQPEESPFVVAYTGRCGGFADGTCLKDMNTGHVVYWSAHDRQNESWTADMQHTVVRSSADDQLYRYSRQDDRMSPLTEPDGVRRYAPSLSPDGAQVAYAATPDNGATMEIRTMDIETGTEQTLSSISVDGLRFAQGFFWSPDGKRLVYATGETTGGYNGYGAQLALLDVSTGETQTIGSTTSSDVVWSADGSRVAFADSYTQAYTVFDTAINTTLPNDDLTTDPNGRSYYSSDAVFAPTGDQLMYVERDYLAGKTRIKTHDLNTGEVTEIGSLPNADTRFEDVTWTEDGVMLMEDRIGSRSADHIIFHHIDPETGTHTKLGTLDAEDYLRVAEW